MLAFLYLLNVVLLTRLPLFMGDGPVTARRWILACLIQVGALGAFHPSMPLLGLALLLCTLAALGLIWDRRARPSLLARRLWLLALYVLGLSVFCSSAMNLQFQPPLLIWASHLRNGFVLANVFDQTSWRAFHGGLCGLLLSLNEANILVRFVIERYELRPKQPGPAGQPKVLEPAEYNRGRIIGSLERLLIFFFVLTGQMAALGFVLTAKGIARFKNLEDRDFAEYFLIGTMISVVSAGLVALIAKHLLIG